MSDDYEEIDLRALDDDELVEQMHDDLYNGLKEEVEQGTRILLERKWGADTVLDRALVGGMQIVGVDFRDGILFVPALLTRGVTTAVPYLVAAAFFLGVQNPPLDAARLDIMPPLLWGRAEAVRTLLRSLAIALAPLLFGAVSDYVFGGGRSGLQWTFLIMILPLGASSWLLFKGLRTYPADVATAAASADGAPGYPQPRDHWGL